MLGAIRRFNVRDCRIAARLRRSREMPTVSHKGLKIKNQNQRVREGPAVTTGAAVVTGGATQRPRAGRHHLQRGHQRVREGPAATTGAALVTGGAT